eukprot:gene20248-24277_t
MQHVATLSTSASLSMPPPSSLSKSAVSPPTPMFVPSASLSSASSAQTTPPALVSGMKSSSSSSSTPLRNSPTLTFSVSSSSSSTPSHSPSPPPGPESGYESMNRPTTSALLAKATAQLGASRSRSPSPSPMPVTPKKSSGSSGMSHIFDTTPTKQIYDMMNPRDETVRVVCRFRPRTEAEAAIEPTEGRITVEENRTVHIEHGATTQAFRFSNVFQPTASQSEVYTHTAQSLIDDVINGYNAAIIAYGKTGTGKTFTMLGDQEESPSIEIEGQCGIIPRAMSDLIQRIDEIASQQKYRFTLTVSNIEVIQERVRDLLSADKRDIEIRLLDQVFSLPEAVQAPITTFDNVMSVLNYAARGRTVGDTKRNSESTRGHVIFAATLTREDIETKENTTSLFYMVDLSGSESVSQTGAIGQRLDEAKSINKSLYALGGVIDALAKKSKHIRYHDSKLTKLLQNCLGGNSKTCLIVNCSSSSQDSIIRDTLSSLHFGERTQSIRNQPLVNNELSIQQLKLVIQQLKNELATLKAFIDSSGGSSMSGGQISQHLLKLQDLYEESRANETKLQENVTSLEEDLCESQKMLEKATMLYTSKEKDVNVLENERREHEQRIEHLHRQLDEANTQLAIKSARVAELQKIVVDLDEWKIKYTSARNLLLNKEDQIKTCEDQKSKWKRKCAELSAQIAQLKEEAASVVDGVCVEEMRAKCELLEDKIRVYRETESQLQSEATRAKSEQKQQTQLLLRLQTQLESLTSRIEVEFPAIAAIVNNQSSLIATQSQSISSLSNSFVSTSSSSSVHHNETSEINNNHQQHDAILLKTVQKVEEMFERISECQQEQTSNIQSFLSNIDHTTITNTSLKEFDEQLLRQQEQVALLLAQKTPLSPAPIIQVLEDGADSKDTIASSSAASASNRARRSLDLGSTTLATTAEDCSALLMRVSSAPGWSMAASAGGGCLMATRNENNGGSAGSTPRRERQKSFSWTGGESGSTNPRMSELAMTASKSKSLNSEFTMLFDVLKAGSTAPMLAPTHHTLLVGMGQPSSLLNVLANRSHRASPVALDLGAALLLNQSDPFHLVIVTITNDDSQIASLLEVGCTDYLSTPFTPAQFEARITIAERSITDNRRTIAFDELSEASRRLALCVEHAVDAIEVWDITGKIKYANYAMANTIGFSRWELLGKEFAIAIENRDVIPQLWSTCTKRDVTQKRLEDESRILEQEKTLQKSRLRLSYIIKQSSNTLLTIINDLLDISKIEAGKLEVEDIEFDLRETVEDVCELFGERAQAKGLDLLSSVSVDVPQRVVGDSGRLKQILTNLLGNSVKFTERGEITLVASVESLTDRNVALRIEVCDTGIGIKEDACVTLFNPYTQAERSTTRQYAGTGLGLAICKELANVAFTGDIWVESEFGKGSKFWTILNFGIAPSHSSATTAAEPLESSEKLPSFLEIGPILSTTSSVNEWPLESGKPPNFFGIRVLLVEKSISQRKFQSQLLGSWNIQVDVTDNAAIALSMWTESKSHERPYSLAIIDSSTVGSDLALLSQSLSQDGSSLPILLLLQLNMRSATIEDEARHDGVGEIITKPIRTSSLLNSLITLLGFDLCTLVVDDNPVNRTVASKMLQNVGCRVEVVSSGKEALDRLDTYSYDLLFLDIQMPDMDGYQVTKEIREREKYKYTKRTPIIALTAKAFKEDESKCLSCGMDDYLSKPLKINELRTLLARWSLKLDTNTPVGLVLTRTANAVRSLNQRVGRGRLAFLIQVIAVAWLLSHTLDKFQMTDDSDARLDLVRNNICEESGLAVGGNPAFSSSDLARYDRKVLCSARPTQHSKFIWIFIDSLARDQATELISAYADSSSVYRIMNHGFKFSTAIYTTFFTGKIPTNYAGRPIRSDNIFYQMKRANMAIRYIGPDFPTLGLLADSPYHRRYFDEYSITPDETNILSILFGSMGLTPSEVTVSSILDELTDEGKKSVMMTSNLLDDKIHRRGKYDPPTLRLLGDLNRNIPLLKAWLDRHPDYLFIMNSDHGGSKTGGQHEGELHGMKDGGNEGFMFFANSKLKPTFADAEPQWLDTMDVAPTITRHLRGVNIPLESLGSVPLPSLAKPDHAGNYLDILLNALQIRQLCILKGFPYSESEFTRASSLGTSIEDVDESTIREKTLQLRRFVIGIKEPMVDFKKFPSRYLLVIGMVMLLVQLVNLRYERGLFEDLRTYVLPIVILFFFLYIDFLFLNGFSEIDMQMPATMSMPTATKPLMQSGLSIDSGRAEEIELLAWSKDAYTAVCFVMFATIIPNILIDYLPMIYEPFVGLASLINVALAIASVGYVFLRRQQQSLSKFVSMANGGAYAAVILLTFLYEKSGAVGLMQLGYFVLILNFVALLVFNRLADDGFIFAGTLYYIVATDTQRFYLLAFFLPQLYHITNLYSGAAAKFLSQVGATKYVSRMLAFFIIMLAFNAYISLGGEFNMNVDVRAGNVGLVNMEDYPTFSGFLMLYHKLGFFFMLVTFLVRLSRSNEPCCEHWGKGNFDLDLWTVELDEFTDDTPLGQKQFTNIIVSSNAPVDDPHAPTLLLCAHYDSKYFKDINFVAAIDSAVSIAMMIEISKSMQDILANSNRRLKLVFFDGEEAFVDWTSTDSLYGSRHLAKKFANTTIEHPDTGIKVEFYDTIELFMLFDLIGASKPTFYAMHKPTEQLIHKLAEIEEKLQSKRLISHKSDSYFKARFINQEVQDDHVPFHPYKIPILHLITVPFPQCWHNDADNMSCVDETVVDDLTKIFKWVSKTRYFINFFSFFFAQTTIGDRAPALVDLNRDRTTSLDQVV